MQAFNKITSGLDIDKAKTELQLNSHLFGEFNARKEAGTIHAQMDDIWVRYGDTSGMAETGDYSKIASEHDSIWLKDLPEIRKICFDVMSLVDGERLGGVLVTKLPPNGMIEPHTDKGWHAEYYDKYYVPIENQKGSVLGFDDGVVEPDEGDVWAFDNSFSHWVSNQTNSDRIALIICIKQHKFTKNGRRI